jgi:hypothetical protein
MRLENWALWLRSGADEMVLRHWYRPYAALGSQVVSSQVWESDEEVAVCVDSRDAEIVDEIIGTLPELMREALRCRYVHWPSTRLSPAMVDALVNDAARTIALDNGRKEVVESA